MNLNNYTLKASLNKNITNEKVVASPPTLQTFINYGQNMLERMNSKERLSFRADQKET